MWSAPSFARSPATPAFATGPEANGSDSNRPSKMLVGFVHYLVVAILAAVIVSIGGRTSFRENAALIFLSGLIGSQE
jgi:hypothetical protein